MLRSTFRLVSLALTLALLLAWAAPSTAAEAANPNGREGWVCPPCVHTDLDVVYDQPGRCPICGMHLVRTSELVHVAILVFDGVQIIDYTAPYEVFGQADFYAYTVSPDGGPIATTMEMHVTPHFSIADAPSPDVLLVPGGHIEDVMADERVLAWIRESSAAAEHVLSVCTGAFLLAEVGLLDGATATTFHSALDELAADYPAVDVVRGVRFVDNGKVVTAAGLSAGLDAALHVVEEIQGAEAARNLAEHLEYAWRREPGTPEPVEPRRETEPAEPEPVETEPADAEIGERRGVPPFRTFGTPASAEDAEAIEDLLAAFKDAWRDQDSDRLAALHAPDVEWINAYARMFRGSDALHDFLENKLFPEFDPTVSRGEVHRMTPISLRYLGDDAAVVHWFTGSGRGPSRTEGRELRRTHLHFVVEERDTGWKIVHVAIFDAR